MPLAGNSYCGPVSEHLTGYDGSGFQGCAQTALFGVQHADAGLGGAICGVMCHIAKSRGGPKRFKFFWPAIVFGTLDAMIAEQVIRLWTFQRWCCLTGSLEPKQTLAESLDD